LQAGIKLINRIGDDSPGKARERAADKRLSHDSMKRGNARENRKQLVDSPFSTGHRNMACNAANDGYKPVKMQSTKNY